MTTGKTIALTRQTFVGKEKNMGGWQILLQDNDLISFGYILGSVSIVRKSPDAGKDWRQEEKGTIEDEMVGWHHWLNGHEFEQALGDSKG